MKNNLGKTATDSVTGFKGTITSGCCYTYGTDTYYVEPKITDPSKPTDGKWFDVDRLVIEQ